MPLDFGILSKKESELLEQNSIAGSKFQFPGPDGVRKAYDSPLGRVAVVALPPIPGDFPLPNQQFLERVRKLVQEADEDSSLVVAVSPWGAQGERYFLESGPGPVDILLGAGPGPGLNGMLQNNGQTLWFRAYDEGKGVTLIDIKNLPSGSGWKQGRDIVFKTVPLKENIREAPEITSLFQNF
jgi:hypothetical protein